MERATTCAGATIVSRSEWGARAPTSTSVLPTPVSRVFIHHSAGSTCSTLAACSAEVRAMQNFHINTNGWTDIGYNFLVGGDGRIYEGRGWDKAGAHTPGYNYNSLGICFIGQFTAALPTAAARRAAQALIGCGLQTGKVAAGYRLHGHRQASPTECPGSALYQEIATWTNFARSL